MSAFEWLRAGHIIAMIAWMAGLLMYPRLLVYRLEGVGNPGLEKAMDDAARRLGNIILNPAMALTWLFGLGLIGHNWGYYQLQPWFWAKIALIVVQSGLTGYLISLGAKVAAGQRPIEPKKLRIFNEVPMLIAIAAVIMVVVQPFSA